ncbi:MAG TPA: hypothetical protein PK631_05680 [Erysipelotrichaceae bacterium]|nr:hypothetical protein [Erysipelotrichaceae bacterium]
MKKILIIIVSLIWVLGSAGCDKKPEAGRISNDWKSFEFELDGVVYKYPWSFNDFATNGWRIMDDADDDIDPNSQGFDFYMMLNDNHYDEEYRYYALITVQFDNRSDEIKKMKDCDIMWLNFQKIPPELNLDINMDHVAYELILAKGITWGSTEAEVIAAYGDVEENFKAQRDEMKVMQYYTLSEDNFLSIMHLIFYKDALYSVNLYRYYVYDGYEHHGLQR